MSHTDRPTVTVCRGCCCGTAKKHPLLDHDRQVADLRAALGDRARLRVTDCLGPCERSNVVVVNPSRHGRRRGGRPTWLGYVFGPDAVDDLAHWVDAGGPGISELPAVLDLHTFPAPGRSG